MDKMLEKLAKRDKKTMKKLDEKQKKVNQYLTKTTKRFISGK